jgi:hypothetical protein
LRREKEVAHEAHTFGVGGSLTYGSDAAGGAGSALAKEAAHCKPGGFLTVTRAGGSGEGGGERGGGGGGQTTFIPGVPPEIISSKTGGSGEQGGGSGGKNCFTFLGEERGCEHGKNAI